MTVQEVIERLKMHLKGKLLKPTREAVKIAIKCIEEVEQYRALGTVEELKEAREKQIAKKLIRKHINTIRDSYVCPTCGTEWLFGKTPKYCGICGQKLGEVGGTSD